MKLGTIVRQGDVLLKRVKRQANVGTPVKRDGGRVVLAYGEVTGHAHAIKTPGAELFQRDGQRFLIVAGVVALEHEEHGKISLPIGTYEVIRQREYTPEQLRQVAD